MAILKNSEKGGGAADRLRLFLVRWVKDHHTDYKNLSLKAGLSETVVRDIVVGRSGQPRLATLSALAGAMDMRVDELMQAIRSVDALSESTFTVDAPSLPAAGFAERSAQTNPSIPVYGKPVAGQAGMVSLLPADQSGSIAPHPKQTGQVGGFALYSVGDAMAPRYRAGEIIYAVQNAPPRVGDDVIVEMLDSAAAVRELVKWDMATGQLVIRQYHPAGTMTLKTAMVKAVHTVVGRG